MFIDADSLKAIMIYILIKAKCVKLLVDIVVCESFTSEAIKYTNRAYYMTVLHTAFEYLETVSQKQIDEYLKEQQQEGQGDSRQEDKNNQSAEIDKINYTTDGQPDVDQVIGDLNTQKLTFIGIFGRR